MKCVVCGLDAGYNRVVVDLVSGIEVGGLCVACERAEFGRLIDRGALRSEAGCAICDRDGFFAVATWEANTRREEEAIRCSVGYSLDEPDLRLCDEHLREIGRAVVAKEKTDPAEEAVKGR